MRFSLKNLKYELFCLIMEDGTWEHTFDGFYTPHPLITGFGRWEK